MVEQTSADDFSEGVSGAGQKWKDRVDTDRAEGNFSGGITSDAASDLTDNAKESSDDYAENLAAAFGIDSVDNSVASEWESSMNSDAENNWQTRTSDASEDWRDGVSRTDASDWEESTSEQAQNWFNNTRDSLSGE